MRIYENFDLTNYNSYRIQSTCKRALFPENENDIIEIFSKDDSERKVIGSGHNIILSKSYYQEDFVIFNNTFKNITIAGKIIEAEAGISMLELSEYAYEYSLSGLEVFYDIPSSLGGAIVMNAGAGGEEIKDLLLKVRYFNPENKEVAEIAKENMGFEYRNSFFQKNPQLIITKAWIALDYKEQHEIRTKMENIKVMRWAKQPRDMPNAGSVFKRPPGRFVGPMIDELGLKGFSIGDAQVSEKHSGFIVNQNNANGQDILDVIKIVKDKVNEKFGLELIIEQRII